MGGNTTGEESKDNTALLLFEAGTRIVVVA
jgi:hypothetical protein